MLKQLLDHYSKFNLLPDFQLADRQYYSKETNLLKMVNDIIWAMEIQEITTVVILDLSAAIYMVNHNVPSHCAQESLWYRWKGDKMV